MNAVVDTLFQAASKFRHFDEFSLESDPQFEHARRVHDWRNHVPDSVKSQWNSLSVESRLIAFIFADQLATTEEWD